MPGGCRSDTALFRLVVEQLAAVMQLVEELGIELLVNAEFHAVDDVARNDAQQRKHKHCELHNDLPAGVDGRCGDRAPPILLTSGWMEKVIDSLRLWSFHWPYSIVSVRNMSMSSWMKA